jgi:hypothetical protein
MKLIIAGGRDLRPDFRFITSAIQMHGINSEEPITEVVSGGATGVDEAGEVWASEYCCKVTRFLPDWKLNGTAAGPIRNLEMANYGDVLLLIWDGKSRGSASMRREMKKLGKPVFEVILPRSEK